MFKVNESSLDDQANNTSANASLTTIGPFRTTDVDDPFQPTQDPFPPTDDPFTPTDDPFTPTEDPFPPTDDPFPPTDDPFPPTDDSFFESSGDEYYIDEEDDGYFEISTEEAKEIESQIEEALLAKVSQENDSTLLALGHQFKDFVFECSFRGYDCR